MTRVEGDRYGGRIMSLRCHLMCRAMPLGSFRGAWSREISALIRLALTFILTGFTDMAPTTTLDQTPFNWTRLNAAKLL